MCARAGLGIAPAQPATLGVTFEGPAGIFYSDDGLPRTVHAIRTGRAPVRAVSLLRPGAGGRYHVRNVLAGVELGDAHSRGDGESLSVHHRPQPVSHGAHARRTPCRAE